jgi:tetrahydromethanopterin S-methyltransferase subunit F
MNNLEEEFICREKKHFRFQIGRVLASSLSGFIAGVVFASIIFLTIYYLLQQVG